MPGGPTLQRHHWAHGADALPVRGRRACLALRVQRVDVVKDLADRQADLPGLVLDGKGLDLADEGRASGIVVPPGDVEVRVTRLWRPWLQVCVPQRRGHRVLGVLVGGGAPVGLVRVGPEHPDLGHLTAPRRRSVGIVGCIRGRLSLARDMATGVVRRDLGQVRLVRVPPGRLPACDRVPALVLAARALVELEPDHLSVKLARLLLDVPPAVALPPNGTGPGRLASLGHARLSALRGLRPGRRPGCGGRPGKCGQDLVLQPEDHRVPVVCHVLLTGAGWLLDIRVVVSHQHVLVDPVPPVLALGEMLQAAQPVPGVPQVTDDLRVPPAHSEYPVQRADLIGRELYAGIAPDLSQGGFW